MSVLSSVAWPGDKLAEALDALARASGHHPSGHHPSGHHPSGEIDRPPAGLLDLGGDALQSWLDAALRGVGLEAEAVSAPYSEVLDLVQRCGPGFARLEIDGDARLVLLLGGGRGSVTVLGRDLRRHRVAAAALVAALCARDEQRVAPHVDELLHLADVPVGRRSQVRRALTEQHLKKRVGGVWLLGALPGNRALGRLRFAHLGRDIAAMMIAHAASYVLLLAAWWLVGKGALEGRLERGWLMGWLLMLLTSVPCALLVSWLQGRIAIGAGAILKRRLLYGVLKLEPDEIRHEGVGGLLGKVMESEAVESLALSGGILVLLALTELAAAVWVFSVGGSGLSAGLLFGWLAVVVAVAWQYYRQLRSWSRQRVDLTNDLVERMVGHRTRLAQMPRARWHEGEDQAIEHYFELSRGVDGWKLRVMALVPHGWMLLGVLGMAPALIDGSATPSRIAASLGGVWLGHLAFSKIAVSLSQLAGAAIAWEQIAPLNAAAARPEPAGVAAAVLPIAPDARLNESAEPVLDARDVHFRYAERPPLLHGCALRILERDRLLLEGPSGGGKSTLAALLVGLREPDQGLILLRGLDRATLGAQSWRRRVAAAPQFHENHVLTGTFAFNLLMGRRWPPEQRDVDQAEALCRALGLGQLLERMPAGMQQTVGDTGWQLSHGERSRVFLARALLQDAELIVLDESFAALDPESLELTMRCTLERAPAMLVIAHP
jgi:ATP-binding cassette subfamily B protein